MVTTDGMLEAYYDCRRRKRRTASAIVYEMNYESNLIALRDRINTRTYQPGKSICFVVTRPRYREVFAASFEDRIVHHYIGLRLEPLFELVFSPRTFNCRKGKGQLYGTNMLRQQIIECSNNYTTDCYIMKLDLQSRIVKGTAHAKCGNTYQPTNPFSPMGRAKVWPSGICLHSCLPIFF